MLFLQTCPLYPARLFGMTEYESLFAICMDTTAIEYLSLDFCYMKSFSFALPDVFAVSRALIHLFEN